MLETIIPEMERTAGAAIERLLADAGYRGHNAPSSQRFRVFAAGQKGSATPAIKREMRRRAPIEPVIGHIKSEHLTDCCDLAHAQGDAVKPILAATGYNFFLILKWLIAFVCLIAFLCRMHMRPAAT